ncbi:protein of unknown function [Tenacibaculum sp. 190524A02b]|uniref:hypothetical protein n=1 Tax=Tenacibaculum vairaonense TaxID=3137860 RepID=UPI0032B19521
MIFTPEVDVFLKYLETRNKFRKSNTELIRQNIFESPENIIVFNKDFINTIESIIDEDHYLKDSCNQYIKKLIDSIDNGSINAGLNLDILEKEIVFRQLNQYESENVLIGVSEKKENLEENNRILNLNNIVRCNKNYIFSKLLTSQYCKISYLDFEENSSVIPVLNHVYSLYNEINKVIIIDRYRNLDHQIYDGLIEKSPIFDYYTKNIDLIGVKSIRDKLKRYKIYNTNDPNLIHQRMIIFNKVLITIDEDPYNILSRNTWTFTIEYSSDSISKIKENTCNYFTSTLHTKS